MVKRDDEVPIPANFPFVFVGVKAEHFEKKPTIDEVQDVKGGCENYSD